MKQKVLVVGVTLLLCTNLSLQHTYKASFSGSSSQSSSSASSSSYSSSFSNSGSFGDGKIGTESLNEIVGPLGSLSGVKAGSGANAEAISGAHTGSYASSGASSFAGAGSFGNVRGSNYGVGGHGIGAGGHVIGGHSTGAAGLGTGSGKYGSTNYETSGSASGSNTGHGLGVGVGGFGNLNGGGSHSGGDINSGKGGSYVGGVSGNGGLGHFGTSGSQMETLGKESDIPCGVGTGCGNAPGSGIENIKPIAEGPSFATVTGKYGSTNYATSGSASGSNTGHGLGVGGGVGIGGFGSLDGGGSYSGSTINSGKEGSYVGGISGNGGLGHFGTSGSQIETSGKGSEIPCGVAGSGCGAIAGSAPGKGIGIIKPIAEESGFATGTVNVDKPEGIKGTAVPVSGPSSLNTPAYTSGTVNGKPNSNAAGTSVGGNGLSCGTGKSGCSTGSAHEFVFPGPAGGYHSTHTQPGVNSPIHTIKPLNKPTIGISALNTSPAYASGTAQITKPIAGTSIYGNLNDHGLSIKPSVGSSGFNSNVGSGLTYPENNVPSSKPGYATGSVNIIKPVSGSKVTCGNFGSSCENGYSGFPSSVYNNKPVIGSGGSVTTSEPGLTGSVNVVKPVSGSFPSVTSTPIFQTDHSGVASGANAEANAGAQTGYKTQYTSSFPGPVRSIHDSKPAINGVGVISKPGATGSYSGSSSGVHSSSTAGAAAHSGATIQTGFGSHYTGAFPGPVGSIHESKPAASASKPVNLGSNTYGASANQPVGSDSHYSTSSGSNVASQSQSAATFGSGISSGVHYTGPFPGPVGSIHDSKPVTSGSYSPDKPSINNGGSGLYTATGAGSNIASGIHYNGPFPGPAGSIHDSKPASGKSDYGLSGAGYNGGLGGHLGPSYASITSGSKLNAGSNAVAAGETNGVNGLGCATGSSCSFTPGLLGSISGKLIGSSYGGKPNHNGYKPFGSTSLITSGDLADGSSGSSGISGSYGGSSPGNRCGSVSCKSGPGSYTSNFGEKNGNAERGSGIGGIGSNSFAGSSSNAASGSTSNSGSGSYSSSKSGSNSYGGIKGGSYANSFSSSSSSAGSGSSAIPLGSIGGSHSNSFASASSSASAGHY